MQSDIMDREKLWFENSLTNLYLSSNYGSYSKLATIYPEGSEPASHRSLLWVSDETGLEWKSLELRKKLDSTHLPPRLNHGVNLSKKWKN